MMKFRELHLMLRPTTGCDTITRGEGFQKISTRRAQKTPAGTRIRKDNGNNKKCLFLALKLLCFSLR
jgi:hypothetical protein